MTHWLWGAAALVMLGTAVLSLGNLAAGALGRRAVAWDAELLHLGMGLAMAGMLDGRLTLVPAPAWLVLFGLGGMWFAWRFVATARRHLTRHLVGHGVAHVGGCVAMAYMLVLVPPGPGMPTMTNLICGARMLGIPAAGSGSGTSPWTFVALTLGLVLLVGACLPRRWLPRRGVPGTPGTVVTVPSGRRAAPPTLTGAPLAVGSQVAMCLTMTVMLVALYR
jgi:hypothetical protein